VVLEKVYDRRRVQVSVSRKGHYILEKLVGFIAQNFVPLDRNWLRYSKKRRPGLPNEQWDPRRSPDSAALYSNFAAIEGSAHETEKIAR
jgi:hypothetical protein